MEITAFIKNRLQGTSVVHLYRIYHMHGSDFISPASALFLSAHVMVWCCVLIPEVYLFGQMIQVLFLEMCLEHEV